MFRKISRKLKDRRGFTLIELMMVIGIIALLVTFLIPRSGAFQAAARESAVEANARLVEGVVQSMIHRYPTARISDFRTDLAARLEEAGIENPITGSDDVLEDEEVKEEDVNGHAVVINTDNAAPDQDEGDLRGVIWVQILNEVGTTVKITPYDNQGNKLYEDPIVIKR